MWLRERIGVGPATEPFRTLRRSGGRHTGDDAGGAGPGSELFPQAGYVVRGQAVGGEPVVVEAVEPLAGVGEVLGGQAGVQGQREGGELRDAVVAFGGPGGQGGDLAADRVVQVEHGAELHQDRLAAAAAAPAVVSDNLLAIARLSTREYGGHVVVALRGELDIADAASVMAVLAAAAAGNPRIIVDLAALEFIDCCALGRVRAQARQVGGDLLLAAPRASAAPSST